MSVLGDLGGARSGRLICNLRLDLQGVCPPRGSEVHALCRSQVGWIASLVFSDSPRMVEAGFPETGLANQTRLTMNVSVFCLSLFSALKVCVRHTILSRPHEGRDGFFPISESLLLVTELHR